MTNMRSEYIKNLIDKQNKLKLQLEEETKNTLKTMVNEEVSKEVKKLIYESEKDNEYEETEVEKNDFSELDIDTTKKDTKEDPKDKKEKEGEKEEEEDIWSDFEKYKDDEGEYDLTGMDDEDVVKVLKLMKPEDGVRIIKNDDGTITLEDDENDTEYVIELTPEEIEEMTNESFELVEKVKNNYEDDDSDYFSSNKKRDRKFGKTMKRRTHKDFMDESTDGETIYEIDLGDDEFVDEAATIGGLVQHHSTAKSHPTNNVTRPVAKNGSVAGVKVKSTSDAMYSDMKTECIKRKADAIFKENKQLKNIADKISEKLNEAVVINASLGKITQLFIENTTSSEEKKAIVERFSKVKTVEEGSVLFETISKELKNVSNKPNINTKVNVTENANIKAIETPIYKSDSLNETLDFMKRLGQIK